MALSEWKNEIENGYLRFMAEPPKSNEDVMTFAALWILRDKLDGATDISTAPDLTAIADGIPDKTAAGLLKQLSSDYADRIEHKSANLQSPSRANQECMLEDMKLIIDDISELIALLWSGSSSEDERDVIKAFHADGAGRYG